MAIRKRPLSGANWRLEGYFDGAFTVASVPCTWTRMTQISQCRFSVAGAPLKVSQTMQVGRMMPDLWYESGSMNLSIGDIFYCQNQMNLLNRYCFNQAYYP